MKIAVKGAIALFLLAGIWLIYKEFDGVRFKTEAYENKIEELAVQIDSLHGQNDSLENTIQIVEQESRTRERYFGAKNKNAIC
jgi:hypothetical protein